MPPSHRKATSWCSVCEGLSTRFTGEEVGLLASERGCYIVPANNDQEISQGKVLCKDK